MMALTFRTGAPLRVLALGAHADDIEIGCGGTVLSLIETSAVREIWWIVLGAEGVRAEEARRSADALLRDATHRRVIVESFADGFFPYVGGEVKAFFEGLKQTYTPDVVFTHQRNDLHQDHRLVSELTWNTFRDHLILEYEVPKYDGDLGAPNLFVPLSDDLRVRKCRHLLEHFASQRERRWFRQELFEGLLRLRGMESNAPSAYAEAFYCRKLVVS